MCVSFCGKAYSVGDGFCYEGIIYSKSSSDQYHFVIDCGNKVPTCKNKWKTKLSSKPDCENRIEEITDEIASHNNIDLFILTHFHEDHYSGYEKLFRKSKIDTIIMPYLYPEERLCLIINSDLDGDEAIFLTNPYSTILNMARENNPGVKMVLIRGSGDDNINQDDSSWGSRHEEFENILEVENLEASSVYITRAFSSGKKIHNYDWMFKFFNLEVDDIKIDQLRKIVGRLTTQRLYDFTTKKNWKSNLRNQYGFIANHLSNDINNTSIVIYHAPYVKCKRCGTLITGDINLKNNRDNKILNYFKTEIDNVGLFSIPHHGSDKNWNDAFIKGGELDNSVAFAITHNYYDKRLTAKMMSDFRCQNISVLVVDENRFSEFKHFIIDYDKFCYSHIINKNSHKLIEIHT